MTSSTFAVDVAENWQSEFLQFVLYIFLTVWLVQRGSSRSKKPGDEGESDEQQLVKARQGGLTVLGEGRRLADTALLPLAGHRDGRDLRAVVDRPGDAGTGRQHEQRLRDRLDPMSLGEYLRAPDFWSRTLQNWQSELLAIGTMVVFAIYLRERGSRRARRSGLRTA